MDYEEIINQLDNLLDEKDKEFVRAFFFDLESKLRTWSPLIRRKFKLTDEEHSLLLNVQIPEYKSSLRLDEPKRGSRKESKTSAKDDGEYYSYQYEDELDDEDAQVPTWQDINPDSLPYPKWLSEVGMKRFFPFPDELLYKVAASICLINSAAIPGMMRSLSLQAELPLVVCYGLPNVGKSTFCNWVGYHYLENPQLTDDYSPFQVFKDDTSYKGLRDGFDKACRHDEDDLREACCHIDDFEPRLLLSDGLWGKSRGIFIAIQRSQATSRVSTNGSRDNVQGKFYYWILKLLSTNHHPKELFSALPKMERRCLLLPFEKLATADNLGNYDWSVLREEYMHLWRKEQRDAIFWKTLLRPLLRKPLGAFTRLTPDTVARSITIMAVGVFAQIWDSVEEAEEHMALYWHYVREKSQEGYQDFLVMALEAYVAERESSTSTGVSRLDKRRKRICQIALKDILEKCSHNANKDKDRDRIMSFMALKGYTPINPVVGGVHVPSFFKELE